VVGWAMRDHMRAELTIAALTMAIQRQRPGAGLVHHSDRGGQAGLKWSSQHLEGGVAMTRRRRRSDGSGRAPLFSPGRPVVAGRDQQRRFWAAIAAGITSEDAARRDLFAYIGGYYNRRRIHSAIGYITPQQAEAKYA
jgi:putative transposase